jgi:hypothetical protein
MAEFVISVRGPGYEKRAGMLSRKGVTRLRLHAVVFKSQEAAAKACPKLAADNPGWTFEPKPAPSRPRKHQWTKISADEGLWECGVCSAEAAGYYPSDTVPGACPGRSLDE